jgi:ADP-ribosyl-[dinitrogen reductase] hydrolase
LRLEYARQGWQVIYLPIADYAIPEPGGLSRSLDQALAAAQAGKHIAVHCHGGIGRTGLFLATLATRALGLPGEQALAWVRGYVPGAVETAQQVEFVLQWPG